MALLFSNYSSAQNLDPVTGLNITGNMLNLGGGLPWAGTVTGAAGGTSGGPTPAYNPSTGNIIFSFSSRTVSQMVAINQALANAGTGIQLGGYRYSWNINNDQSNYGGNRGTLTGNVSLIGSDGDLLESFNYDYTKLNSAGFTKFSASQLFENRYSLASVSSLTVSFTGKDQNSWAGYYGPRVHVNEFSLLYTAEASTPGTDPCVTNPLSSTKCPGYGAAFVPKSSVNTATASAPVYATSSSTADSTTSTPAVNIGGAQLSATGTISAPDNIPQTLKDVQAVTQQSQSSTSQSTNQPSTNTAPNMSLIMSTIGRIQANDRAAQTSAVQNANRAVAASSAAAQEQAMAVAAASNSSNSASTQPTQQTTQTAMLSQPVIASSIVSQDRVTASSQFSMTTALTGRSESADGSTGLSLTTNKSISMNDLLSARMNVDTAAPNTTTDTVNKNTQPNELAGRVDIASIATQPKGFDVYATLIIKDADFYAPKDIYGNQRTIDNARALRLLSSDRLHQEMIDLQYRR